MLKKYGVQILFILTVLLASQLMTSISQAQEKYITPGDAGNHVGEVQTVCGEVGRIDIENLQPIFIKLYQQPNTRNFTIVIYPSDRSKFNDPPVYSYLGKKICVKGMIKTYKNEPEIILHDPSQITIVHSQ
jgi:DNA/RNA endonuclease YhcR with UshA esterase domain